MNATRPCHLRIVTSADGEESVFSADAEMELCPQSALLRYRQDGGRVILRIGREEILLERTGDYTLSLRFAAGECSPGVLGIAGSEGKVETFTHRAGMRIGENSVLLSLHYTLRLEGGDREIKLRLTARVKGDPEEK